MPAGDDRELPTGDTITTKRCEVACGSKRSGILGTKLSWLPRFRGHPTVWVFGVHNGKAAPYAPEFRRQMIELVRAGRTPEDLAKEFEPSAQAIRNWVAQADRDEGRREDGLGLQVLNLTSRSAPPSAHDFGAVVSRLENPFRPEVALTAFGRSPRRAQSTPGRRRWPIASLSRARTTTEEKPRSALSVAAAVRSARASSGFDRRV